MIIVLEGIDGSGKTTVARLLCQALRDQTFDVEYWPKSSAEFENPFVRSQTLSLRELIWEPAGGKPTQDVMGTHYYMFLIAAWFSIVERHRLQRIKESDTLAVFDGWFYRNIAKAFIRDKLDKAWLGTLFAHVSAPDLVMLLDIDPSVAWGRRSQFTLDEVGRWDGYDGDGFNSYCAYQQSVREQLLEFAAAHEWNVINQTQNTSVDEVVAKIRHQVLNRLGA